MYMKNNCNCNCNNMNECLEDSCSYVQNLLDCNYNECECGFDEEDYLFPQSPVLAQSYVPWQVMNTTFTPKVGLKMGTLFPELVSPYAPGQSALEIAYLANNNEFKEGCNKC